MIPVLSRHLTHSLFFLFICTYALLSCEEKESKHSKGNEGSTQTITSNKDRPGILIAKQYCGSCHSYVSPEILPTEYWKTVLTRMSSYMGFNREDDPYYGNTPLARMRLDSANIFPDEQIISYEEWQKLVLFYLNNSPDTLDHGKRPPIDFNLTQFKAKTIPWKTPLQGPSFLKILKNHTLAVGFSMLKGENEFNIIDLQGNEIQKRKIPSALTSMDLKNDEIYFSFMGKFEADDTPTGVIGKVRSDQNLNFTDSIAFILKDRERPIHIQVIDMNLDQRTDLLVAEFGKFLGGLYLYIQNESGTYDKKTIYKGPGSIKTIIRDVNEDGLPDIYALISQGKEGIYLFTNQGDAIFETRQILEFPPYYGSVYMDLVDFDQDGIEDLIYANGDSGDFGNPVKPFHGIRFFKGKGNQVFEEEWFYPQQGTYKSLVMDFDQDGDLDIATIGFFAYGTPLSQEGFLYLENIGSKNGGAPFKAYSFKEASGSSFMVMDVGDIDGDGDQDLILGASSSLMNVNEMVGQLLKWESAGGAVMLLENILK